MLTVALISQKGGSGKSTLACAIAVAGEIHGRSTVLIDLDPQGSATNWAALRNNEKPVVTATTADRLRAVLDSARAAGAHLAVVDTPPHSTDAVVQVVQDVALVLIPCRPAAADLLAIGASIKMSRQAGTEVAVVLNAAPVGNPLVAQAQDTIRGYNVSMVPVVLHQRVDHVHAFTVGQSAGEYAPRGKAARELAQLFAWICKGELPFDTTN